MMYQFTKETLNKAWDYDEFLDFTERAINKEITMEPYDNEAYLQMTASNHKRSAKILSDLQLNKKLYNELSEGVNNWTWVLFDEPWCSDASFSVPVLQAMELASGGDIDFKIYRRDAFPEIMEHYLTNNGKAIPKLVCLNKDLKELGTWGPRPAELQSQVKQWVAEGMDSNDKLKNTMRWYRKDKSESIQKEFIDLVKAWKAKDGQ